MKRLGHVFLSVFLIVILLQGFTPHAYGASETVAKINAERSTDITVKLVFIGISEKDLNKTYFLWSENVPDLIQSGGVKYRISYQLNFTSNQYKIGLLDFLKSIQRVVVSENPMFDYFVHIGGSKFKRQNMHVKNVLYDAEKVEKWLYDNRDGYGGFPENGYTFVFMYFPELPTITYEELVKYRNLSIFAYRPEDPPPTLETSPHYYSSKAADWDLGYSLRFRQFATGWGGHYRLWYYDFSAGPSWWSPFDTLPLQIAMRDQGIILGTTQALTWLTNYVADYAWNAVYNFAVPQPVYPPFYSKNYRIALTLFDDRNETERNQVPIKSTINLDTIRHSFEDLVPYSKIGVSLSVYDLKEFPELKKIVSLNSKTIAEVEFHPNNTYVDLRPVYKHLQDNLDKFRAPTERTFEVYAIPVFVFAFTGKHHFTISYKWAYPRTHPETQGLLGVALTDMALVSMAHEDFILGYKYSQPGKGLAFTEVIVHEVGHMFGLPHPHAFDDVGDFSFSAMGYYSWDYEFSVFEKDFLWRAHADHLIVRTYSTLREAEIAMQGRSPPRDVVNKMFTALNVIGDADVEYGKMNYREAIAKAVQAREMADEALRAAKQSLLNLETTSSQVPLILAASVIPSLAAGMLVGALLWKRKSQKTENPAVAVERMTCRSCKTTTTSAYSFCPTCGEKLTP